MSDPLSSLDLKFLPDWLKESPAQNRYADYDKEDHSGGEHRGRGPRGPRRPGDRQGDRPPFPRGEGRREGKRPQGQGDRRGPGGPRRDQGARPHHRQAGAPGEARPRKAELPAPVRIDFIPEPIAAENIAKQIKNSARAYPLFGTARMFLEKPERHGIRITSSSAEHPLHQIQNGPLSFDISLLERNVFRQLRDTYYREETHEIEAPKGNYTSVARCRATGTLLGPTSHHAYQVALRKLFEERFSRRMSFAEFQRHEIEVLSSEQAVADWKAQMSKQTVYITTSEEQPLQFNTLQEAESHFRKTYLPTLIKTGVSLECSGKAARDLPEQALTVAAREAFDRELAYPASIVNGLRDFFAKEGLQVFKHRKRVLYISSIRPKRADSSQQFASGPAHLLKVIEESPRISKRELALKILGPLEGEAAEQPEAQERKTQLAADLHYLVHAGHVIEFSDGRLDLPLAPNAGSQKAEAASESAPISLETDLHEAGDHEAGTADEEPPIEADHSAAPEPIESEPAPETEPHS